MVLSNKGGSTPHQGGEVLIFNSYKFPIRMDGFFFADPDPDFKNLDRSVLCFNLLMGCKLCSLDRF